MKLFAKNLLTLCLGLWLFAPNPADAGTCPFDTPNVLTECRQIVAPFIARPEYIAACKYLDKLVEQLCQAPYPQAFPATSRFERRGPQLLVEVMFLDDGDRNAYVYQELMTGDKTDEQLNATAVRVGKQIREDFAPKPPPGVTKL